MDDKNKLANLTCAEFCEQLKSDKAVPSGGSAAALVGAIGAALGSMTALFCTRHVQKHYDLAGKVSQDGTTQDGTDPGKALQDNSENLAKELQEVQAAYEKLEVHYRELLALIDKDARVFIPMSSAYKMPHKTEEEKCARQKAIQDALNVCVEPPMQVLHCCTCIIELLEPLLKSAGKLLIGDVACAASMLQGACIAAEFSIYANTRLMKDEQKAKEIEQKAKDTQEKNASAVQRICSQAKNEILIAPAANANTNTSANVAIATNTNTNTSAGANLTIGTDTDTSTDADTNITSKVPADNRLLGKPVAQKIDSETLELVTQLQTEHNITPTLTILRIEGDEASDFYEKSIIKKGVSCNIEVKSHVFPADLSQKDFLKVLEALNNDKNVHGIMVFRPLPKHFDEHHVCSAISPQKDVDSASAGSLAYTFSNTGIGFVPCTAQSCIEMLDYYGIDMQGKHCVILGRSLVVGKPVSMLVLRKNATVTILHSHSKNAAQICQEADIIIAAIGRAQSIDKAYLNPNKLQVVLDVGINVNEQGKLVGDALEADLQNLQKIYSPVPGGVGSTTTSVLLNHVALAAKSQALKD